MQDKRCTIHDAKILAACFYEGCSQHFLCMRCFRCHPDSHDTKMQEISTLMEDVTWIKLHEGQRDFQIAQIKGYCQEKDALIAKTQGKLEELIVTIVDFLKHRLMQWTQELNSILSNQKIDVKGSFAMLEESLGLLSNVNFRDGGIYEKINRVKLFNENELPKSVELCKQVETILNERKVDQRKLDSFKADMLGLIESICIEDLFNADNRETVSEGLTKLRQEHETFKENKNKELETLSQQLESIKQEKAAVIAEYEKNIASLEEKNTELQKEILSLQSEVESIVEIANKDAEVLATSYNKLLKHQNEIKKLWKVSLNKKSRILTDNDFLNIALWTIGSANVSYPIHCKLKLLYRASRDGFIPSKFYQQCKCYLPTISFIKSKEHGRVFGGYILKKWDSKQNGYVEDEHAFLFSLTHSERYPIKKPKKAIFMDNSSILSFGAQNDFQLYDLDGSDPSKARTHFPFSYKCSKYSNPSEQGAKSYLAGSYEFSVEEIEVYSVDWC